MKGAIAMIRAVLFDLDGTLTDTIQDISDAMNRSLRLHGLPEWTVAEYCYLVGDGAKILAQRAVRERQDLALSVQKEYQAYYETHTRVTSKPYDGIPEMLRAMTDRGFPLAVFSNKPDADTKNVVSYFFPDVDFKVVRGQVEGVPVKPDPMGALAVADSLGVRPEEVLYLGDTATDMRCAVNSGMQPVGVLWGFRKRDELEESGAKWIIAHPAEALALLEM